VKSNTSQCHKHIKQLFSGLGIVFLCVASILSNLLGPIKSAEAASGPFLTQVAYSTGAGSRSVVTGDFNNDGILDLAVANYSAASPYSTGLSVLVGTATGTFGSATNYTTLIAPSAVIAGDFDNDGDTDLAVTSYAATGNVSIFKNSGAGLFVAKVDYAVSTRPYSLTSGDFNADGNLDLAVANSGTNTISILNGTGTAGTPYFGSATNVTVGTGPYSITAGDFDRDGDIDLATANYSSTTVSILLNASGVFTTQSSPPATGTSPYAITAGYIDNDNIIDLAVANYGDNTVSILIGTGTGTFTAKVDYATGVGPRSVTAGDLNNDGFIDLATTNFGSGTGATVSIKFNQGDGTFLNTNLVTNATQTGPHGVTTGDFNADGKLDLAVANYGSGSVSILLSSMFDPHVPYTVGTNPRSVTKGDFNADGILDLATANYADSRVSILIGDGDGTFTIPTPPTYIVGTNPTSVISGDFNADGQIDLAVTNAGTGVNSVSILKGNGNGTFASHVTYAVGTSPYAVTAGDFNGDTKPDLAVANLSSNTVSILIGTGSATAPYFNTPAPTYAVGTGPMSITTGDFDADGKLDLATANSGTTTVSILIGTGSATAPYFTIPSPATYTVGTSPYGVTTGDFDGDANLDLAVANRTNSNISILIGNGDGTFVSQVTYTVGTNPSGVTTGDFNADTKLDLAVANFGSNTVSILIGDGDGTFATQVPYTVGSGPYAVTTGDFNADTKLDIAVANYSNATGGNCVSILINTIILSNQVSTTSTSSATANNSAPVASNTSIDGGAASITLTENATKNVVVTATVTDNNGCPEISGVSVKFFQTDQTASGGNDPNIRYTQSATVDVGTCTGVTDTVATYTATIAVQYYANPTDTGSINDATDWTALVTPSDAGGAGTTNTDTIEMATLTALDVTPTISYGTIDLAGNTGATNQTTTVTNTGNESIGTQVDGYGTTNGDGRSMTCTAGNVTIGNEKYSTTNVTYGSLTGTLTDTAATVAGFSVAKVMGTPTTGPLYWGFAMPASGVAGSCGGVVVFTAV
jgi:hypothetical protein